MTADFLVIGAGIAGLSFALRAARHGSVIVVTKGDAFESNTAWAQGGIASVLPEGLRDAGDSVESHVADTLDAGAGLCSEAAVRTIVQEGAAAIRDLLDHGVSFDRENEHFLLGKEGGHSHRRILHAKDTTGREVARALIEAARNTPNITLLENHFVIDLITSAKLGAVAEDRVLGAYVLERKTGEVGVFRSDRVILAAGGCGKVYLYTTNPDSATGDGVALGWRAGAMIANMEFIQFHPTCFYNPGATGPEAQVIPRQRGGARRGRHPDQRQGRGFHEEKRSARLAGSARHRGPGDRPRAQAHRRRLRLSGCDPQAEGLHGRAFSLYPSDAHEIRPRLRKAADPRGSRGALSMRRRPDRCERQNHHPRACSRSARSAAPVFMARTGWRRTRCWRATSSPAARWTK